jgi:outer membrane protein assembly factor BamB
LRQKGIAVGIVLLFLVSSMTSMLVEGNKNQTPTSPCEKTITIFKNENYDIYRFPEGYPNVSVLFESIKPTEYADVNEPVKSMSGEGGVLDSPWPMFGHDAFHTGRSSYNTENNTGYESWYLDAGCSSPVISDDGTIYTGPPLTAIFPNGTLKWEFLGLRMYTAPVLDDNGTIFFGTAHSYPERFYALNPNGTEKWNVPFDRTEASPVLTSDGTIIAPECNAHKIVALFPTNGTRKWEFQTNHVIYSSPAIGLDGTIYCGCHDGNIYALYPNGTLRWSFHTDGWVHGSPSIGTDGTVYCGSDDGYLYAFNPDNGSLKWRLAIGASYASPTIGPDGTLYIGVWEKKFYAINPNGTIVWSFDTSPGKVWGSTAALSADGTLYFATADLEWSGGVEIIALWINGTVKWRRSLDSTFCSPAIGRDGTIYIGSRASTGAPRLHAFGTYNPNAPAAPVIQGPPQGRRLKIYSYDFTSTDPLGKDVWYYVSWGDGTAQDWIGPYPSGETMTLSHRWDFKGTYTIEARVKNTENLWGPYGTLEVTMPLSYEPPHFRFFDWLLERFPHAFPIIRFLLDFN